MVREGRKKEGGREGGSSGDEGRKGERGREEFLSS